MAKLLYGEITALTGQKGFCYASNRYFADLYNCDERQVRRWITQLAEMGVISVVVDKAAGNQRHIYVKDALPLRTKKSVGGDKKVLSYGQKSPDPTDKKVLHNNTVNNKGNNTVNSGARAENQPDVEKEKKEKAPPIPGAPPAGVSRPVATTFAESIWSNATTGAFAQALQEYAPETADADAGYYRGRCRDWSAQHPDKKKADWLAFAAQIINDDRGRHKLVTIQPISSNANGLSSNHHAPGSAGEPLVNLDRLRERARDYADRFKAKNPGRYKQ